MKILDGKNVADALKKDIARDIKAFVEKGGRVPYLVAILVGDDGASATYVANKEKACQAAGMRSMVLRLPGTITQTELLQEVARINADPEVDGLIVQLPLPDHIDERAVVNAIDPTKDVDGFHPENVGKMMLGEPCFVSATPAGVLELLAAYGIRTRGKHCVILGRSNIVGRPLSNLLSQKGQAGDCTVTLCHTRTENLKDICQQADILVAAIGRPGFVKADMVKKGAVVIDVGITRIPDPEKKSGYRLMGDVDFPEVAPKCSYITPVPGGVGPMTILSLLKNTFKSAKNKFYKE